jgi:hypothetical protein
MAAAEAGIPWLWQGVDMQKKGRRERWRLKREQEGECLPVPGYVTWMHNFPPPVIQPRMYKRLAKMFVWTISEKDL